MVQMVGLFYKSKFKRGSANVQLRAAGGKPPTKLFTVLATATGKVALQIKIVKSSPHSTCKRHSVGQVVQRVECTLPH